MDKSQIHRISRLPSAARHLFSVVIVAGHFLGKLGRGLRCENSVLRTGNLYAGVWAGTQDGFRGSSHMIVAEQRPNWLGEV